MWKIDAVDVVWCVGESSDVARMLLLSAGRCQREAAHMLPTASYLLCYGQITKLRFYLSIGETNIIG